VKQRGGRLLLQLDQVGLPAAEKVAAQAAKAHEGEQDVVLKDHEEAEDK
jgi:hypothetical protein